MAEERLIDDDLDKNKKFKIRKNADGEDELYMAETDVDEEETFDDSLFEIPEFAKDDEEAAILTPEQLAAREEERRLKEEQKRQTVQRYLSKAQELYAESDYDGAGYQLNSAENTDGKCGDVFCLKIKVLTRSFTDFSAVDECVSCAEGIRYYCTPEQKAELCALSSPLENHVQKLEEKAAALHVEVEGKKSERRAVFEKDRNKSISWFTFTIVPFIACLIVAIAFGSVIFAKQDGTNLIITIVFAALALIFFIATLFTSHKMWSAMRKVSLNEKNSSTRLGRDYESLISEIKKLKDVLSAIKS